MTDPRIEAAVEAWVSFVEDASLEKIGKKLKINDSEILHNIREGMALALSAADASAWRPMSEAPRDGTLMLVSVKHIGCDVVSWWGAGWRETTNGLALRDEPTHWQPLPAPPKDEVKE